MDAGQLSVKKIFGQDRRHIIPLFQRPYVWKMQEQWEPFWDDVRVVTERILRNENTSPHFLGAIVLDQVPKPTGHLETRLVIDGQQRLTTLQIFLEAFCDLAANVGMEDHHLALRKLTRNDDPLSKDPDETLKVWPTNSDRDHFRRVMFAESPEDLLKKYGRKPGSTWVYHQIGDAYLYFYRAVLEWLKPEEEGIEDRVEALYTAVAERLRMVVIDLGTDDDAQLIFETLNARGTPLLASDLIKNYLFHKAQDPDEQQRLYSEYWSPFDHDASYWRAEVASGRLRRARIDLFLQHFLTLKTKDDVLVTALYKEFRDYTDGRGDGEPQASFASIKTYSEIYRSFEHQTPETRQALFFERLSTLQITTAYPFLLELTAQYGDEPDEILTVLEVIESFLVRRLVCQMTAKNYNRLFIDLLGALDGEGTVSERVRGFLTGLEGESVRWPRDAEFRLAWTEAPLYRVLARARLRMLLEAVERKLRTEKTENVLFKEALTVEHVMPQAWQAHWPLPPDEPRDKAYAGREKLVHTMGNLTLLTKVLNPGVSNLAWVDKRAAITKHSALALNREFHTFPDWNEETIRERANQMFKYARELWPNPQGDQEASAE